MWTATITRKEDIGGQVKVWVAFTDGTHSYERSYLIGFGAQTYEWLKREIDVEIKRLQGTYAVVETMPEGQIAPTDTTPTQAQQDQQVWFENLTKLEKVQQLITLGVLTGSEPKVVSLRNKVKTDFKPEYIYLV